jgi:hypothetical protein
VNVFVSENENTGLEALRGLRSTRGESHQWPLEEEQDQAASLSKMRRYFYDEGFRQSYRRAPSGKLSIRLSSWVQFKIKLLPNTV